MKYSVLFLLTLCGWSSLVAQSSDSLTIRMVDSLIEVAYRLTSETEFRNALDVNTEAERIALESFGQESIPYGECCSNRGRIYSRGGQYREAELWYQKALNIQEIVLGKEDPEYALTLNRLAIIYFKLGDFTSAKALFIQSGNIRKRTLGENHPDYASSLVNLANVSMRLAELEQAVPVYKEAKNIFEHSVGTLHPHYATCLMNLAGLYCDMGQYLEAEPLYLEACSIYEKKFGQVHPDYAMCLNNLSTLYEEMANIEKAYSLRVQATAIYKEMLGNEHPDYAWSLSLLAYTSLMLNQFEEAESLYLEVRTIIGNVFGKNHTRYARSLSSLGTLYRQTGRYDEAQQLLEEAKAIVGMALGKEHIEYARILTSLALIDSHRGQYKKAESNLVESRTILENVLGRNHMMYARSVTNLAVLYAYMDMPLKSGPFFQELSALNQRMISRAIYHLSGQEMIQYVNKYSEAYHQMHSFLWMSEHRDLIPTCFDNSLFYKGFLLQSSDRLKRLARSNELTADKYGCLMALHRRLAAQYSRSIATRDTALVVVLEHEANDLEKELARDVASFGNALQQVTWREVQAALPADGIAVEFVHFSNRVPARKDGIQYAAFVLRPGSRMPEFIPLFEEEELDHLLQSRQERKADYVNDLYAWSDRGLIQSDQNKRTLNELIWSKIEASGLTGINTVYYSPTGVLHRINLGAIPLDETTVLSDRYNMIELNSTRQLAIPDSVVRSAWNALLVGGVQFEADQAKLNPNDETLALNRSISTVWTEAGPRQGTWSSLPWTWKEVEAISTTLLSSNFNVIKYSGSVATEEVIKAVGTGSPSPRVLHLATHGYFFPDPDVRQEDPGLEENESTFKASDNPMMRSGLILAGGNYAWQYGQAPSPDREDGILTAYEISQMNLANTELVVLSACETGLGDIQGNEGVYGLQRAFKIAGAKYLIMSLWQVPDRETMQFMTTFYRNWLPADATAMAGNEEKMSIPEAFRKTQLEMRDRFFNPYSWAGFVLVE